MTVAETQEWSIVDWATMNPLAKMIAEWIMQALEFVLEYIVIPAVETVQNYSTTIAFTAYIAWYGPGLLFVLCQCFLAFVVTCFYIIKMMRQ